MSEVATHQGDGQEFDRITRPPLGIARPRDGQDAEVTADPIFEHVTQDSDELGAPPATAFETAPEPPRDLFISAVYEPSPTVSPAVTLQELRNIDRRQRDTASTHLLTTVLLRLGGDSVTIADYEDFLTATDLHVKTFDRASSTKKSKAVAQEYLDEAEFKARPYISVLYRVNAYAETYRQEFLSEQGTGSVDRIIKDIYTATEDSRHPALDYFQAERSRLPSYVIEAERVFRMILIDAGMAVPAEK